MSSSLILHAGAVATTREDVLSVVTPPPQGNHYPVGHDRLIKSVIGQLVEDGGYTISNEKHSLGHDGARYFGVFDITRGDDGGEYALAVGVRNSHDKTFSASLVLGTRVFVCDNLAFGGEVKVARKHTRFINRDMDSLISRALGQLGNFRAKSELRINSYKGAELNSRDVHDLLVRAVGAKAIAPQSIIPVLHEYNEPSHEEFAPRNMWSLFNAFTEIYKRTSVDVVRTRSQALHGLFDAHLGLAI
jgi:hypothetical protein